MLFYVIKEVIEVAAKSKGKSSAARVREAELETQAREWAERVGYSVEPVRGGRNIELNPELIELICSGLRKRVAVTEIFRQLKIPVERYFEWLRVGKRQPRGIYRQFYSAATMARQVGLADIRENLESALVTGATTRSYVLNVKTTRLISLTCDQATVIDEEFLASPELAEQFKEGIIVKQEVQSVEVLPDAKLAKELLLKIDPDWGKGS